MPNSFDRIILHTIFGTKYRRKVIGPEVEGGLYHVFKVELNQQGAKLIRFGIVADHVHLVHSLPRTATVASLVKSVKAVSSKWLKRQGDAYQNFAWQIGYSTFSADYRKLDGLKRYVDNQKVHHGYLTAAEGQSYRAEFLQFLKAYDLLHLANEEHLFPEPPPAPEPPPSSGGAAA